MFCFLKVTASMDENFMEYRAIAKVLRHRQVCIIINKINFNKQDHVFVHVSGLWISSKYKCTCTYVQYNNVHLHMY